MPGFIEDPRSHINLIKDNLSDRYRLGFPVLRELIQNADDAGATQIEFGWIPGVRDASHPLLTTPAILAVNNGRFTRDDENAIRQLGLSAKPSQQPSIGKFGLGLKSVFHLCEAFFYIYERDGAQPEWNLLNPWYGIDGATVHQSWEPVSSRPDARALDILDPLIAQGGNWFCLWIPLRTKSHCSDGATIWHDFHGDILEPPDLLRATSLPAQMTEILPLLANVQNIRVWRQNDGPGSPASEEFEIGLQGARRRYEPGGQGLAGQTPFSGAVTSSRDGLGKTETRTYAGVEVLLHDRGFEAIKAGKHWPRITTSYSAVGARLDEPDKAEPHAAACFIRQPAQGLGVLDVNWAVFLPVDEPHQRMSCPGTWDYSLLLHGYFFVDAGRARIHSIEPEQLVASAAHEILEEATARKAWNVRLAREGTLPLILPALDLFAKGAEPSEQELKMLTAALADSSLISELAFLVCNSHQWVYALGPSGGGWRLVDANQPVFGIPSPPHSAVGRPFEVFKNLQEFADEQLVTYVDWPRLSSKSLSLWPVEALARLLDVSVEEVFSSQTQFDYLVRFLEDCGAEELTHPLVAERLLVIGREALASLDLVQLTTNRSLWSRFLALIPTDRRFPLKGITPGAMHVLFQRLCSLDLGVLPYPDQLAPPPPSSGSGQVDLPANAAGRMLHALGIRDDTQDNDTLRQARSDLAVQVLEAAGPAKPTLLEEHGHVSLFWVRRPGGAGRAVSWKEMRRYRDERTLFCFDQPPDPEKLAPLLQSCLAEADVLLVNAALRDALFDVKELSPCTSTACAQTLMTGPSLRAVDARVELCRALVGSMPGAVQEQRGGLVKAIRYLLHGQSEHLWGNAELYTLSIHGHASLWLKLMGQALDLLDARWRLAPKALVDLIPGALWSELGLMEIGSDAAAVVLKDANPDLIDCSGLTETERDLLLRDIQDEDLLRSLHCHPDADETLHSIGPTTFWQSEFRIHADLRQHVVLLRRSHNTDAEAKQRRLANVWSPSSAISVALATTEPSRLYAAILDALSRERPPATLADALKSQRWLPTRNGSAVAPQDVLHVQGLEDEVGRIVAHCAGAFAGLHDLIDKTTGHQGFQRVQEELLEKPEGVLGLLGVIIEDYKLANYQIGSLAWDSFPLDKFIDAFTGPPPEIDAAWSLVAGAAEHVSESACKQQLLPKLLAPMSMDRLLAVLEFLAQQHEQSATARRGSVLQMHSLYLREFTRLADARTHLPAVRLLNEAGAWKQPGQLCNTRAQGVDEQFLLSREQAEALLPILDREVELSKRSDAADPASPAGQEMKTMATAQLLTEYFAPWRGVCHDELVGALLALLGDDPQVRSLAQEYLKNHTVEVTRERLGWMPRYPESQYPAFAGSWASGDVHQAMKHQQFTVQIQGTADEQKVELLNLLGERISVPLSPRFEHLLLETPVPPLVMHAVDQDRTTHLQLRWLDAPTLPRSRLASLLKETARQLLETVYRQQWPKVDQLWEELEHSEQLDLEIAQDLILEGIFFYINQLGLHSHPRLTQLVQDWESARRMVVEAEWAGEASQFRRDAERAKSAAKDNLRDLLETDREVQSTFLSAVKEKVGRHYQYRPTSIPFEVFQNADDAMVELGELYGNDGWSEHQNVFHIAADQQTLSFLHWGRPINHFGPGAAGRRRGYDRDLEKMLVLSASDKGIDGGNVVTGKFGLGFKSTFLLSDCPRVVSDRLAFTVVGGVFPERLGGEGTAAVGHAFQSAGIDIGRGTVMELPITQDATRSAAEAVENFAQLGPVLVVFARRIRSCVIHLAGGGSHSVRWAGVPVLRSSTLETGAIQFGHRPNDRTAALVLRGSAGDLLLALGTHGFQALPRDVPSIWVTTPTSQGMRVGFALNGRFEVDVGRAQLAHDSATNELLADRLGQELGQALCELFLLATARWEELKADLRLDPTLDRYAFWESLWTVLVPPLVRAMTEDGSEEAHRLLQRTLWGGPESGVAKLVTEFEALPSGLPGPYRCLTRPRAARFVVGGCLDEDGIFVQLSNWATFQRAFPLSEVVSTRHWVPSIVGTSHRPRHIDLADVVGSEVRRERDLNSERAGQFGEVVSRPLLERLRSGNQTQVAEYERLKEAIKEFRFKAADGQFRVADELLIPPAIAATNEDEHGRAAFAPADRVLSSEYSEAAVAFFEVCRGELSAPTAEMVEWALNAASDDQRIAVLRYLVSGVLSHSLAWGLRPGVPGSWLQDLTASPVLESFSLQDQAVILGRLNLVLAEWFILSSPGAVHRPRDAKTLLGRLHTWWEREGGVYRADYLQSLYGSGELPQLSTHLERLRYDIGVRESWLSFLITGSTFTLGRTRPEQDLAFLNLLRTRGWLRAFSDPDAHFGDSLQVLDEYFEGQLDESRFFHWMRLFVPIFQLSRWLPEYVELFLGVDRRAEPFALSQLLRPRTDSVHQGGGIDAPPLDRTLGLGACFVLRELRRSGLLSSHHADPHCYMPTNRIVQLLEWLGFEGVDPWVARPDQSHSIYSFLCAHLGSERAIFGSDFDIPLLVLAHGVGQHGAEAFLEAFDELPPDTLLTPEQDIEP